MGWEDVDFLATGFLNFDMSSFLIFCFFSFPWAGLGASSSWLGTYVGLGLGSIKSRALDSCGVTFSFSFLSLSTSANFPHSLLRTLLSLCFVLSHFSSEDQSENGPEVNDLGHNLDI